jgi:hypothetical protein
VLLIKTYAATRFLKRKGSFMGKYFGRSEGGPTTASKKECKSLLEAEQIVPDRSLSLTPFRALIDGSRGEAFEVSHREC